MSNSLDPDLARQFVGPDLGPNCGQRLSADDTCKQRVTEGMVFRKVNYTVEFVLAYQIFLPFNKTFFQSQSIKHH